MLAHFIAGHGLDHGVSHTFAAEMVQRVLNEPPAEALSARLCGDGKVWDARLAGSAIDRRGDIANDFPIRFRHECSGGMGGDIVCDMARFSPAPVVTVEETKLAFHNLIKRNPIERFDRDTPQDPQVARLVGANDDVPC